MRMRNTLTVSAVVAVALFLAPRLVGRQNQGGMKDMHHDQDHSSRGEMHHEMEQNPQVAQDATESTSHEHMEMNAHMYMTALRPANPADEERAEQILDTLRQSIEKYKDYRVALAAGYRIFAPNLLAKQKHFTNWGYGYEAEFVFGPAHPTSLLYDKTSDGGWKLVGAMYTAPKRFTEDQLNERVPLSVARWHKHINFCFPPKGQDWENTDGKKFGMIGSISTEEACQEAGERWAPQLFGWMVHVYPFEKDPAKVWAH